MFRAADATRTFSEASLLTELQLSLPTEICFTPCVASVAMPARMHHGPLRTRNWLTYLKRIAIIPSESDNELAGPPSL